MNFQFTSPHFLWLLPVAWGWAIWLTWKSDAQLGRFRRGLALAVRMIVLLLTVLSLAGLQWLRPLEGVNVFFLLDRSESIPSPQQESARKYVNSAAQKKEKTDKAGVLVFGTDAAIEISASPAVDVQKINAVVPTERTDMLTAAVFGPVNLLLPLATPELAIYFLSISFFIASVSNVAYNVAQISLRQAITPERFLGRMNATMRFLVWGTIPIGSLIGAGLSELVGVRTTIWVSALLGFIPFVFVLFSKVRSIQTIPTEHPDAVSAA